MIIIVTKKGFISEKGNNLWKFPHQFVNILKNMKNYGNSDKSGKSGKIWNNQESLEFRRNPQKYPPIL